MAAEAMFSCPFGAALKMRVNIFGQQKPIPTPTRNNGAIMAQTMPPPDPWGIISPSAARPRADSQGPQNIRLSAKGFLRPELMNEPVVHPADIKTIQYPARNGDCS